MKNVYYLSALVLKIQYTQKFEDKYKQNESLSSLSRLGWVIFFLMSHFEVSQDLDESFSSLSRLGWVTFKSRKTLMRSGKKRNGKPKFQGDWGDLCRGHGGKRDEKGQKKTGNSVAEEFWSCNGVLKSFHLYQFRNKMNYWKHKIAKFWDYWKICTGV